MVSTHIRVRGEEIRRFLLENVEKHPANIAKLTSNNFKITRQAVHKHIKRLIAEKALTEEGHTKNRIYKIAPLVTWERTYKITPDLAEGVVWSKDISLILGEQPRNVRDIWHYGFTEMFNNAMDHSEGSSITVVVEKTAIKTKIVVLDDGVGIFKKIQAALNLLDERHSVLELAKGKFTTNPAHHTGQGIFFTSRIFDYFCILSGDVYFSHTFGNVEDWILDTDQKHSGTWVRMELSNHTARVISRVFDQFAAEEDDFGFTKTVVPVRLAQYGDDRLVSRSQAKRVLARFELFKTVLLDFTEVPSIGQAFADEVFRVFPTEHPVNIIPINYNSEVHRMIARVMSIEPPSEPQLNFNAE